MHLNELSKEEQEDLAEEVILLITSKGLRCQVCVAGFLQLLSVSVLSAELSDKIEAELSSMMKGDDTMH